MFVELVGNPRSENRIRRLGEIERLRLDGIVVFILSRQG